MRGCGLDAFRSRYGLTMILLVKIYPSGSMKGAQLIHCMTESFSSRNLPLGVRNIEQDKRTSFLTCETCCEHPCFWSVADNLLNVTELQILIPCRRV